MSSFVKNVVKKLSFGAIGGEPAEEPKEEKEEETGGRRRRGAFNLPKKPDYRDEDHLMEIVDNWIKEHDAKEQEYRKRKLEEAFPQPNPSEGLYDNTSDNPMDTSPEDQFPYEIKCLLQNLTAWKCLELTRVWPAITPNVTQELKDRKFLWLSADAFGIRFPAHEDCCDNCDDILDVQQFCCPLKSRESLVDAIDRFSQINELFESLECLRLFRFNIDETVIKKLSQICPKLTHLDLTECRISNTKSFRKQDNHAMPFPELVRLILTSTAISGDMFYDMISDRKLEVISANGTNITENELKALPSSLKRLDIRCCPKVELSLSWQFFRTGFPLVVLRIEVLFNDAGFGVMCDQLKSTLEVLELYISDDKRQQLFTEDGLKCIPTLTLLKVLKFVGYWSYVRIPICKIVERCPDVRSFTIDNFGQMIGPHNLSAQDLSFMALTWRQLEKLELKNIVDVTKIVIDSFSPVCNLIPTLRHLDLTQCPNVDDSALVTIKMISSLRSLIVDKCSKVTAKTFWALVEKARQCPDEIFSGSFLRCDFSITSIKQNELPKNLRVTIASLVSRKYKTFDGARIRELYFEDLHKHLQ